MAPPNLYVLFWKFRKLFVTDELGCNDVHYIYLDIDPKIGINRVHSRGGEVTHFDEQDIKFHERVRKGGMEFMNEIQQLHVCHILDASKTEEEVFAEIEKTISDIIGNSSA
jgi:dTMP kinase